MTHFLSHGFELHTAAEGAFADARHGGGHDDLLQYGVLLKGFVADLHDRQAAVRPLDGQLPRLFHTAPDDDAVPGFIDLPDDVIRRECQGADLLGGHGVQLFDTIARRRRQFIAGHAQGRRKRFRLRIGQRGRRRLR